MTNSSSSPSSGSKPDPVPGAVPDPGPGSVELSGRTSPQPSSGGHAKVRAPRPLPACRVDADGRQQVDLRAILTLAFPLFLHAGLQAVLNLTDTWFLGQVSSTAVAGVGGVYWLILGFFFLFTGTVMSVQPIAAQAYGAGHKGRAAQAAWSGFWLAGLSIPALMLLAWSGQFIVPLLGLPPEVSQAAIEFWGPRFAGGPLAMCLTAVLSFFLGIGHVRTALMVNISVAILNAVLNAIFVYGFDAGVAGIAWATTGSIALGLAFALFLFLRARYRSQFRSHRFHRWNGAVAGKLLRMGIPLGLSISFDVLGLAAFQAMVGQLGAVQGAATQVVMMLTSVAYLPAVGLGKAGTTLVGQSIGAGNPQWAGRVGNRVIGLSMAYMLGMGLLLGVLGEPLMRAFIAPSDPEREAVVALGVTLAWIACAYQVFDGLHLGSIFCLRGAGDTQVPAYILLGLSWGVFVPLAHVLVFAPGQGWVGFLPGLGLGAVGGWIAALVYIALLAVFLGSRWKSRRWA